MWMCAVITKAIRVPHATDCTSVLCAGQGALLAFYKRFLESPNFAAWFERQREAAWAWQEAEWTAAAAVRGEGTDLSGLDEVQVDPRAEPQIVKLHSASPKNLGPRCLSIECMTCLKQRGHGAAFAKMWT